MAFDVYSSGEDSHNKYKNYKPSKNLDREYSYKEVWDALLNSSLSPLPKPLKREHRIVIVDADAVVYRVSSACEQRAVVAEVLGKRIELPTKTKLKAYCDGVGVDFDDVKYEDVVYNEPVGNCLSTLKKTVKNIYQRLNATNVIFIIGGSNNFRTKLKFPTKYKGNRADMRRPKHLQACKDYLNKYYDTYIITGVEADDVVQGLTSYIVNKTPAWGCAYNLDKDFHTSPNKNRYYHPVKDEVFELGGGIGSLYLSKNSVKGEGLMWLMFQVMMGDPSDGFSPKVFFNRRYGEKSFYKDFKECMTEKELLEKWILKWKELIPNDVEYTDWEGVDVEHDWLSLANLYFQAPYMRMNPSDVTTFTSTLDKYGVEYE